MYKNIFQLYIQISFVIVVLANIMVSISKKKKNHFTFFPTFICSLKK